MPPGLIVTDEEEEEGDSEKKKEKVENRENNENELQTVQEDAQEDAAQKLTAEEIFGDGKSEEQEIAPMKENVAEVPPEEEVDDMLWSSWNLVEVSWGILKRLQLFSHTARFAPPGDDGRLINLGMDD